MGEVDTQRQELNVFRMELLGAKVDEAIDGLSSLLCCCCMHVCCRSLLSFHNNFLNTRILCLCTTT